MATGNRSRLPARPTALVVAPSALADIRADARRCYPAEAIGLLGAPADSVPHRVCLASALPNRARRPGAGAFVSRLEVARRIAALVAAGFEPVGAYHSHPDGAAEPSDVDLRAIRSPGVEIIAAVSPVGAGTVRGWWIEPGHPPVELTLGHVR